MKFDGSTLRVSLHTPSPPSFIYAPQSQFNPLPPCQKMKFKNGQTIIDILMKFDGSTLWVSLHPPPPPSFIYAPPFPVQTICSISQSILWNWYIGHILETICSISLSILWNWHSRRPRGLWQVLARPLSLIFVEMEQYNWSLTWYSY